MDNLPEFVMKGSINEQQALSLAKFNDTSVLMAAAEKLTHEGFRDLVTYSKKVFIPLTQLCRDVCHYCTFAQTPASCASPYLLEEEIIKTVQAAKKQGCKEALFTLGERPELRYRSAQKALDTMGFATTLDYLAHIAKRVFDETGILPHINAGCMNAEEMVKLRSVSASMGIMLESVSERLCEKGMPHYRSPDKVPAERLNTLRIAGEQKIPFTSGILIGIGETRKERIESLLALRKLHQEYGHLQEIIIQNFRAKPLTKMANAPEPSLDELLWTIAITRIIFGPEMSIQAPPNLSPDVLPQLLSAGINDWGGVSPVTPDFVNPEAPWPHLAQLAEQTAASGKYLQQRLTIYPQYALNYETWLASELQTPVLRMIDAEGFARTDDWMVGQTHLPPEEQIEELKTPVTDKNVAEQLVCIVEKAKQGEELAEHELVRLFQARGQELAYVCQQADQLRQTACGKEVTYVVTRNINYTNVCYFNCRFCAFAKGKSNDGLRGRPYDLNNEEIARRISEAWQRGATEVCMQGGIHPDYTGDKYLDIIDIIRTTAPYMHIHAFSPLEVWQGANSLGLPIADYLQQLRDAGLGSLPGTAAEILDDEIRAKICSDKINTRQWLEVVESAHQVGLKTTATIMFGHVDQPIHWAKHILKIRNLQMRTGGFTEFVPLPYVPLESPLYLKGKARPGPTFRESVLMHAVARLALHGQIGNIQTSWTKLGLSGISVTLNAGANDLGGTLMNESITRSAGAKHGQELTPQKMEQTIVSLARLPRQRNTLYGEVNSDRLKASFTAGALVEVVNTLPNRKPNINPINNNRIRRALHRSSVDIETAAV